MNTLDEIYSAFKSLQDTRDHLQRRFKTFFEVAAPIWDTTSGNRYNLLRAELTSEFDGAEFEIKVCGRFLRFAYLPGLTEDGVPRGVINCTTPDLRLLGSTALICAITFHRNGDVDYPPKPADLRDPLQIDDYVSALYIVSYCISKVLLIKASTN